MRAFASATAFLAWRSAVNQLRRLVGRLREPRYAVGVGAAALYLWFGVSRWGSAPARVDWSELAIEVLGLLAVASAWVFGGDDAVVRFTEAEIQHLFPAPVPRWALLVYKMVRGGLASVPYSLVATVFVGGRLTDHPAIFAVGAWLGFLALDLHTAAASLTRATLVDAGLAGLTRRVATAVALAAALGGLGWAASLAQPPPADPGFVAWVDWAVSAAATPPLGWALWPIRAPIEAMFAQDALALARALPGALAVVALHAAWLLAAPAPFEDGSVRAAERLHVRRQAMTRGTVVRLGSLRLPLSPTGRPEGALVWKGVIASFRLAPIRLAIGVGTMVLVCAFLMLQDVSTDASRAVATIAFSIAVYLALFGSTLLRSDLRLDLGQVDLRSLPLTGRAVVAGELAGPALVLAAGEWLALLAAAVFAARCSGEMPVSERLGAIAASAVVLPVVTGCGLVAQNAAAVLYPEWERQGGFDAVGRRLLMLFTNLLVAAVAFGPGLVFALPALLLARWIGALALPLAAVLGVLPVTALLWLAIGRMGRWLEQLDPSA